MIGMDIHFECYTHIYQQMKIFTRKQEKCFLKVFEAVL